QAGVLGDASLNSGRIRRASHRGGFVRLIEIDLVGSRSVEREIPIEGIGDLIASRQEFRLPLRTEKEFARGGGDRRMIVLRVIDGAGGNPWRYDDGRDTKAEPHEVERRIQAI